MGRNTIKGATFTMCNKIYLIPICAGIVSHYIARIENSNFYSTGIDHYIDKGIIYVHNNFGKGYATPAEATDAAQKLILSNNN